MKEELYTTILERQLELGDVYFLSCLRSSEGNYREVSFSRGKTVVKIMLAASLLQPAEAFASEVKTQSSIHNEMPELVECMKSQNIHGGRLNVVQEGPVSLEVTSSPSYRYRSHKVVLAEQESLEKAERSQLLLKSLDRNKSNVKPGYMSRWTMCKANLALSQLPFSDAILQYVSYDDIWHYNLYFANNLEMSVSVYVDEDNSDNVDFSVYHHGELVVANVLPMNSLVKKMKSILSKSANND